MDDGHFFCVYVWMDDELFGDDGDGEILGFFQGGLDVGMMFRKNKKGVLRETVWVQYNKSTTRDLGVLQR